MANALKMNVRSEFISSSAKSMEPSLPRNALPPPHTVTKVTIATTTKFTQIDIVTKKCNSAYEAIGVASCHGRASGRGAWTGRGYRPHLGHVFLGGRSISTNEVSVKPP